MTKVNYNNTTLEKIKGPGRSIVSGPFGSNISSKFFVSQGVPIIRGNNLSLGTSGPRFLDEDFIYLTEEKAEELKASEALPGDLIFTARGTIGQVGVIPLQSRFPKYILSANQLRFRPDPTLADVTFLYYWFSQPSMVFYMQGLNQGSALPNMNLGTLRTLPVAIPPLPEQRAIADVLSALDDKIELNRRINQTLEQLARALFKHMFINNPEREGWEEGTLGDLALNLRRSVQTTNLVDHDVYIGLEHMPQKSIALGNWGNAETVSSNKFAFKRGEILFGKLRPYFHKVGVAPTDGVCSTDILVISPKIADYFGFVLSVVSSTEFVNTVNLASEGTKMPRTNWNYMAKYPISIPSSQTAKEFNNFVQPIVEQIISNIFESRTLSELRDTLLPRLMSGQVCVKY